MKRVTVQVKGISRDRRTTDLLARGAAIEQSRADQATERAWRDNVQNNRVRRALQRYAGARQELS